MKTELQAVMAVMGVAEMDRAVGFYEGMLGFAATFRNGNNFTIVRRDAVEIGLALDRMGAKAGKGGCYVKLTGIDAIYEELRAKGVGMTHELRAESYGMREFMTTDPDGNTINFGEAMHA